MTDGGSGGLASDALNGSTHKHHSSAERPSHFLSGVTLKGDDLSERVTNLMQKLRPD